MNLKLRVGYFEVAWLSWLEYSRRGRRDGSIVRIGSVGPFPAAGPWAGIIYRWRWRLWRVEIRRISSR
jgi:hypothetical protein